MNRDSYHFENITKSNQYTSNNYRPAHINDTTAVQFNQTNVHQQPNIQINNDRRHPYTTSAPRPPPNVTIINNTGKFYLMNIWLRLLKLVLPLSRPWQWLPWSHLWELRRLHLWLLNQLRLQQLLLLRNIRVHLVLTVNLFTVQGMAHDLKEGYTNSYLDAKRQFGQYQEVNGNAVHVKQRINIIVLSVTIWSLPPSVMLK